jgi:membrane-associated HD superfamily phosphohydrolase
LALLKYKQNLNKESSKMALEITYDEVNIDGKKEMEASIKNHDLVNALVRDPEATIKHLQSIVASIDLGQISIDDYGTVIVKNPEFVEKVKKFILNPVRPAGNNCYCQVM